MLHIFPENPTSITVSHSGGKDSTFMLILVANHYAGKTIPIRAHHQIVPEDWEGTVEYVAETCEALGIELWTDQAYYEGMRCSKCQHTWLTAISRLYCTRKGCNCECEPFSELISKITDLRGLIRWRKM